MAVLSSLFPNRNDFIHSSLNGTQLIVYAGVTFATASLIKRAFQHLLTERGEGTAEPNKLKEALFNGAKVFAAGAGVCVAIRSAPYVTMTSFSPFKTVQLLAGQVTAFIFLSRLFGDMQEVSKDEIIKKLFSLKAKQRLFEFTIKSTIAGTLFGCLSKEALLPIGGICAVFGALQDKLFSNSPKG